MGTGFTIDTPLKVARFGVPSVISLVDDKLIERMRKYYCGVHGEPYSEIADREEDARSRRITAYLNLVNRIVDRQTRELAAQDFTDDSDLTRYFEMLDGASCLKQKYLGMRSMAEGPEKEKSRTWLRQQVIPGAIDVNIMTKADRENLRDGVKLTREYSDAMAALRGFASSDLRSAVVFSAGLNLPLYGYVAEFADFRQQPDGSFRKTVTLKVSDFRSAHVQAKIFAKKGIWVSEYRIESGLNCGGHAFPTEGLLLGPILDEFNVKRDALAAELFEIYRKAAAEKYGLAPSEPPAVRVTAQGGVGTACEHRFLLKYYRLDSVGWGSPFLLVPEATTVDDETLVKLARADADDIRLTSSSPLGVPFYSLKNSASEVTRDTRIKSNKPGSPCVSKYLAMNTEFGEPLCPASFRYQSQKIRQLDTLGLLPSEYARQQRKIVEKACICRELGDGVMMKYGMKEDQKALSPAVCPGPNLAYFSKVVSLRDMIGHIYGELNVLGEREKLRPNLFVNEAKLYVDYLRNRLLEGFPSPTDREKVYFAEFRKNLLSGIEYYARLTREWTAETRESTETFLHELERLKEELESMSLAFRPAFAASPA